MHILEIVIDALHHQAEWVRYTGGDPQPLHSMIMELQELKAVLGELMKSYECYTAENKPTEEWDEYDYMMLPVWTRLGKIMRGREVDNS